MTKEQPDMFTQIVSDNKLDPFFKVIRSGNSHEPARQIMAELWDDFVDLDRNFLEQWQSTAFDARTWEFFLFAYLSRSGYVSSNKYNRPDFVVTHEGITVAIEAVTTNPSPNLPFVPRDPYVDPYDTNTTDEEIRDKQLNELPIRFGSPLFSKLNKRYWELTQCRNIPLVFAIEAFHDPSALQFSDASLAQYLYGLHPFPVWADDGILAVQTEPIEQHKMGTKTIPSNFFGQPDTEYISAILFGNVGTISKFNRMGFQEGYGVTAVHEMVRQGLCYDPDSNSDQPAYFSYQVSQREPPETWGEGLVVMLNPNALHPLPRDYFVNTAQTYLEDGILYTDVPQPFHPYSSRTVVMTTEVSDPVVQPLGWLRNWLAWVKKTVHGFWKPQ